MATTEPKTINQRLTPEEVARVITNYANSHSSHVDNDAVYEAIYKDHPTLQQGAARLFVGFFLWIAEQDRREFDLRSQDMKVFSDTLKKLVEDGSISPYFGLI